jgi:hypothetical protein
MYFGLGETYTILLNELQRQKFFKKHHVDKTFQLLLNLGLSIYIVGADFPGNAAEKLL